MGKTLLVSAGETRCNLFTQPRVSCSLHRKLCLQGKKKETFCINALRDSWAAAVLEAPGTTPWWAAVTMGGSGSSRPAAPLMGGSTKGRLSHVFYLKFGRTDERGRNRSHLWFHLLAAEVAIPTHPT